MLIDDGLKYNGMKRTALIYSNKAENSNKYYIIQLEQTKDLYFKVTFKYGRRGLAPTIKTDSKDTYSLAYNIYRRKIEYLKNKKGYIEVDFFDIMSNDSKEFFDINQLNRNY